jgi:integrase
MKTRERFLTPEERRHVEETLLRGLQIPPGRKGHLDRMGVWALQLLSLTGLRRDEIRGLTWPMVDWQHSCLNLPDTKTGQRNVPVPSQVMALLGGSTTTPATARTASSSTRAPAGSSRA